MKLLYPSSIENQKLLYKKPTWNTGKRYTKETRQQITSIMNKYKESKICKFCGVIFKPKHSRVCCSIKCLLKMRKYKEKLKKIQKKQQKLFKFKEKNKTNIIQKFINPYELEKIELKFKECNNYFYLNELNIPNISGIYFIFDIENNLIYIGQSIHIFERIYQHSANSMWFNEFAKKIAYIEYEGNLDEIEMKYILKYNTRFNSQSSNYDNSYTQWNWYIRKLKERERLTLSDEEYYHLYPWEKPK